jgi:hypothetical protein
VFALLNQLFPKVKVKIACLPDLSELVKSIGQFLKDLLRTSSLIQELINRHSLWGKEQAISLLNEDRVKL